MQADKIIESILQSAKELFRHYGYNKTSVNEIAKKAKVAKATIYKYFESKELILHSILMEYVRKSVDDLLHTSDEIEDQEAYLGDLIFKVSRISYIICNEFIGWDFIRESTNAQEYMKTLSDDLENLLIQSFKESNALKIPEENLRFLIKSSKNIVFSFAFTSVSVSDVRKNFISFQKEILPYLIKGAVAK